MTIQNQILTVFQDILGEDINSSSDFFEQGGDSLDALASVTQLADDYSIEIKVDAIYQYPTAKKLADYLDKQTKETNQQENNNTEATNTIMPMTYFGVDQVIPAYYTQRLYFYKKKNNSLFFEIKLTSDVSDSTIKKALESLIALNPILKSSFKQNNNQLELVIHDTITVNSINYFSSYDKNTLTKQLKKNLFEARYNGGLLVNFVTGKSGTTKKILIGVDHGIFDGSSISIFKEEFMRLINQQSVSKKGQSFIAYSQKQSEKVPSSDTILSHPYLQQLLSSNQRTSGILKKVPKQFSQIIVDNVQDFDGSRLSYLIGYLTSRELANNYGYSQLTMNLILNLRQFKNLSLVDTIGDIHSTIPLIYTGESYQEFLSKSQNLVQGLFINQGFNPRLVTYQNYPNLSDKQKQIRAIIGGDIPISISFIGIVEDEELPALIHNIQTIQIELSQTADLSRMYVTAVLCKNKLHIFYDHAIFKEDKIIDIKNII